MATTLNRMERDGLVRRAPDPDDGRRVGVHLTRPARRLEQPLTDAVRAVNRRALRGLSAEERSLLYGLTERLRVNLGARSSANSGFVRAARGGEMVAAGPFVLSGSSDRWSRLEHRLRQPPVP